PKRRGRSGPKGPPKELIEAIVEMKRRNPSWGCPRIAQQITLAFDVSINKDVVRRTLAAHYHPSADSSGPSWLTFIGHAKDSLWSLDLFRCESATLRTHWVPSSWTNSHDALSGLVFIVALWMASHYAGCSIGRSAGQLYRSISAWITIPCIASINGKVIFACSRGKKTKMSHKYPYLIPSFKKS